MIFLYRFELLALDGALSDRSVSSYTALQLPGRTAYLLTNYERAIDFGNSEPFTMSLLPRGMPAPAEGWVFHPERISHDGLRFDGEKASGKLTVSLPLEHPLSQVVTREDPGASLYLTMAKIDDDSGDDTPRVVWAGRLSKPNFDESRCTLSMAHVIEVIQQPGLTRDHPRTCPYPLYDGSTCGINAHAFDSTTQYFAWREDGFVSSVSGDLLTITVPEAANRSTDFFKEGFALVDPFYALTSGGSPLHLPRAAGAITAAMASSALANGGIRRSIGSSSGSTVTLRTPIKKAIPIGTRVSLYAGCTKLATLCDTRFHNYTNFGGFPDIPTKNPYESGIR